MRRRPTRPLGGVYLFAAARVLAGWALAGTLACSQAVISSGGGGEPGAIETPGGGQPGNGNSTVPGGTQPGTQPGISTPTDGTTPTTPVPGSTVDGNGALPGSGNQATTPNAVVQQPNGPAIVYLGRFDTETDPNMSTMAWPGSAVKIGFDGSRLLVNLNALDRSTYGGVAQNVWVAGTVDGGAPTLYRLDRGPVTLALAQNLTVGHHEATLTLRTEAQLGRLAFLSATAPDGRVSYTAPVSNRRIEFVGDSGAAGYGADGTYPCDFTAATENALAAYPHVVGELLGAEVRNLSFSGKGLVQNRDMENDAEKVLPVLWQRTLPFDDPYVLWDTNAWHPQAVVLITGGNDFYVAIPEQEVYVGKLTDFIGKLKAAYPGVKIFLGASPMLRNDSHPNQRETAIAYLRLTASRAADPNVAFIDIPGPDLGDANSVLGNNGFGCDMHPSPTTHRKVAQDLATKLRVALGW